MTAPSVLLIEMAADVLCSRHQTEGERFIRHSQSRELQTFGDGRAKKLGASGLSDDFKLGYALGMETARMYLQGNPLAVEAGVTL